MKQSELFTKTERESPKDEESLNAKLLIRAGFIDKLMAGVYSYLPLGLRVLRNIETIIREEMEAINGKEILMAMLHPKQNWLKTGGWDGIDVLFKIMSRTDKEYALGQSEEEVVTPLVLNRVRTYKEFPLAVFQIHWKFRDELRSKSGLLRGREFLMKDMYSFHIDQKDFDNFYAVIKNAYKKIFNRLGLEVKVTEASGGNFTEKISYEFMVIIDAGEDDILYCNNCDFCVNLQIAKVKEGEKCEKCSQGSLALAKASEVGNVFDLGEKYGRDFELTYTDKNDQKQYPIMGSYGIGVSRLIGVLVEKFHDENGIIWPLSVAPYKVHILPIFKSDDDNAYKRALNLYNDLVINNFEVLFDDRANASAGEKFADADLLGIPFRIIVGERNANSFELVNRNNKMSELVDEDKIISKIQSLLRV